MHVVCQGTRVKSKGSILFFYFYVGSRGQTLPAEPSPWPGMKIFFFQMPFGDFGVWSTQFYSSFFFFFFNSRWYLSSDTLIQQSKLPW